MQFSHPGHSKSLIDQPNPVHQINVYITQWFNDIDNSNLYRHLINETCSYINNIRSQDSAVSIQAMLQTRQETFLFFEASILPLGHNQPPIKWVLKTLSPGASGQDTKLTIHLHLVTKLIMSVASVLHITSWEAQRQLHLPPTTQFHCFNYTGQTVAPTPNPNFTF